MKTSKMITAIGATMLLTATIALAASDAKRPNSDLADAKQRLAERASGQKGYPRAVIDQERARISNLIDDLEAGRQVDSKEIDRALERANRVGR